MSWSSPGDARVADLAFVAIDFEGAGARPGLAEEPVQVGLARLGTDRRLDASECFDSLLRPQHPVTAAARRVHGIGTDDLAGAPTLAELWPRLATRLRAGVLIAYGAATERRYLEALPGATGPVLDLLPLVRAAFPDWPGHALGETATRLGLGEELRGLLPQRDWHDALFDAVATALVLRKLLAAWNEAELSLEELLHPDLTGYNRARRRRAAFPEQRPR